MLDFGGTCRTEYPTSSLSQPDAAVAGWEGGGGADLCLGLLLWQFLHQNHHQCLWPQHCSLLVLPLLPAAVWQFNSSPITSLSFTFLYSLTVLVLLKHQLHFLCMPGIDTTVCQLSLCKAIGVNYAVGSFPDRFSAFSKVPTLAVILL